jgi:regulator of protease activity HflC (stomatin/prohibitin superfamily)
MGWFIAACITAGLAILIGAIAAVIKVPEKDYDDVATAKKGGRVAAGAMIVLTLVFLALGSIYTQSVGQGVIVTRIGGAVIKADNTPGLGVKAPWDTAHKWDLFTRDISLAGDQEAKFDNGEINAAQIATSVKSGEESGAQVWYDLDATYNIDNADLKALYSEYRDQDRFTRQVVYPAVQKAARSIPSSYTTTEFRGAGSVKAGDEIADAINDRLAPYGVEITVATVKSINFTEAVEASLSVVEEKQQQEEAARADAAAKQVQNEQMIKDATAKAEANRIESDSLTPELLALRQIEGYKKGDTFYVPQDSPLILSKK